MVVSHFYRSFVRFHSLFLSLFVNPGALAPAKHDYTTNPMGPRLICVPGSQAPQLIDSEPTQHSASRPSDAGRKAATVNGDDIQ